jgi:hypothetical protein
MKKILLTIVILGLGFTQDTEPPWFATGELFEMWFGDQYDYGYITTEWGQEYGTVDLSDGVGQLDFQIAGIADGEYNGEGWDWNCWETSSGIDYIGIELVSPTNEIYTLQMSGMMGDVFEIEGNLSQHLAWGSPNIMGCEPHNYIDGTLYLPLNSFELGTYDVSIIAADYAGNIMNIGGEELESLGFLSTILFTSSANNTTINPFEDYAVVTWNWANGDNIIVADDALDIFEMSDTLYVYDDNALISNNCDDIDVFGPALLNKYPFINYPDNINLYCSEGFDECDEYNYRYSGYIEGNPMLFSFYDNSNSTFYDLIPEYASGNGLFGVPFDLLTFKYYNIEDGMIYDINESIPFEPNMILGDAITYHEFTINENSGILGPPNWDFDYHYYEYNGSIACSIDGVNIGDIIVALFEDEVRGFANAMETPFNTIVFNLMVYGNPSTTTIESFEIGSESRINFANDLNIYNNNRGGYQYNIYKDGNLLLENYTKQYYFDYDLNEEICYEIFLIDNYDNSEFLTTDELCFYFGESEESILGDVNNDLMVNVVDVVMLVDIILNNNSDNFSADINQDGLVNVVDVVILVDIILNG